MNNKTREIISKVIPNIVMCKYRAIRIRITRKEHKDAFSYVKKTGKIVVVFIVYQPQLWNSLKTVYKASKNNINIKTYVIVTGGESRLGDDSSLTSLDYYRSECTNVIDCTNEKKLIDLKELCPDFIFRQTPYDMVYPAQYSIRELAKIAKTCYVPYNYNFSPSKHLYLEYGNNVLANLYAVFSESESNADFLRGRAETMFPDLNVFYYGFPRFDLIKKKASMSIRIKKNATYLWIPRWSTDDKKNDATSFFKYKDNLIQYFQLHRDLNLIIRPHPLMFDNFIKLGIMTKTEVEKYKNTIKNEDNICFDDNIDYLETFIKSDVLIADMSSINYEFYLLGKPMIYCGDPLEYNSETKNMMKYAYKASKWIELEKNIKLLYEGVDSTYNDRRKDVMHIFENMPSNIGESIIERCVSIIRGND